MVSMDMHKTVLPQGAEYNCKHTKNKMPESYISRKALIFFFRRGNGMEEGMRRRQSFKDLTITNLNL